MPGYALKLEYDGTGFVGWQRQTNGLSLQQVLEEAATKLAEAAQLGQRVQGGPIDGHVEQAAQAIIQRAKEMVR